MCKQDLHVEEEGCWKGGGRLYLGLGLELGTQWFNLTIIVIIHKYCSMFDASFDNQLNSY